jgi:hypothetical protein
MILVLLCCCPASSHTTRNSQILCHPANRPKMPAVTVTLGCSPSSLENANELKHLFTKKNSAHVIICNCSGKIALSLSLSLSLSPPPPTLHLRDVLSHLFPVSSHESWAYPISDSFCLFICLSFSLSLSEMSLSNMTASFYKLISLFEIKGVY